MTRQDPCLVWSPVTSTGSGGAATRRRDPPGESGSGRRPMRGPRATLPPPVVSATASGHSVGTSLDRGWGSTRAPPRFHPPRSRRLRRPLPCARPPTRPEWHTRLTSRGRSQTLYYTSAAETFRHVNLRDHWTPPPRRPTRLVPTPRPDRRTGGAGVAVSRVERFRRSRTVGPELQFERHPPLRVKNPPV